MRARSILVVAILFVLPLAAARADVVILEGNDVPLHGEIVSVDDVTVIFRIQGLHEDEWLEIERSRVRGYWRENGEVSGPRPRRATPAPRPAVIAALAPSEPDRIDLALSRMLLVVPEDPGLRVLLWLAAYGALTLLLTLGGRLADIEKLRTGRAAILALFTEFLLLLGVMAARAVPEPMTFPLLLAALATAWVLTARVVTGEVGSKSVLLLGFTVSTVVLLAGSLLSVLSATLT